MARTSPFNEIIKGKRRMRLYYVKAGIDRESPLVAVP